MEGCCKWLICGLVSVGALGLIILFIFFMSTSGGGGIAEEISGNGNEVISTESRELSMFHFTSLSERLDDHEEKQGYHNYFKYTLFAMVFTCVILVIVYKCVTHKANKIRRRRMNENLDLVELHQDSLETHGILKKQMTNRRRQEIEKEREENEEKRKLDKKKRGKETDKEQEEEDTLKQKPRVGDESLKQKQGQKKKQEMRWIQVAVESEEEL